MVNILVDLNRKLLQHRRTVLGYKYEVWCVFPHLSRVNYPARSFHFSSILSLRCVKKRVARQGKVFRINIVSP